MSDAVGINTQLNYAPQFVSTPSGIAKSNTNNTIIVTANATDQDVNDTLTYTLWWGTSSGSLSPTNIIATGKTGQSVTLEKTGLSNDTRYYFKVVVSDGVDEDTSAENTESTYCLGSYCDGVSSQSEECKTCSSSGTLICNACSGSGGREVNCTGNFSGSYVASGLTISRGCASCSKFTAFKNQAYQLCSVCSAKLYTWSCSACDQNWWSIERPQLANYSAYPSSHKRVQTCSRCGGSGHIQCSNCSGKGEVIVDYPCQEHSISGNHYYCTSGSSHGNNITQYHK